MIDGRIRSLCAQVALETDPQEAERLIADLTRLLILTASISQKDDDSIAKPQGEHFKLG